MKVSRQQVALNRTRILDAAARFFREKGLDGVTVSEVMKAAGLTHGGFYGYFQSKDDLVARMFEHVHGPESEDARFLASHGNPDHFARYLSDQHRDNPGGGCVIAALGTEAVRSTPEVREAATAGVRRQIEALAQGAAGETPDARRQAAIQAWALALGAVVLARAVNDPALSDEILDAARAGTL